ncbi:MULTISPECIES: UvrD-helicase domain-containing protein [Bacteroides]|uniref:UvrD-helicase domain-containing protein n=1 Tax=Bacteroides TaxID=816 RepID=UPI00265A62BB|nr:MULTISPECIES: UvrD-helicase domain-containing protein [Bacteroides]
MEIKSENIAKAEQLLLPDGCSFDPERVQFITRLESGDLLAVPGSGKTTALRAKLYCMAKELPMKDGRGILALSHTNVAVDELKKMLQNHCPQLFEYPNFVGTIQEFVDTFLALPYYVQKYGHREDIIDADQYERACTNLMNKRGRITTYLSGKLKYGKDYKSIRLGYSEDGRKILRFGIEGKEVEIEAERKWLREGNAEEKVAQLIDFLFQMKEKILNWGVLHYDDCYYLAETNIREHPDIVGILRKRFAYVFVDEAQDMKGYQLKIIDKCFNCDSVVLQRIGDPNQAIFDGFSMVNTWESRTPTFINNSLRLTQEVASVVDHLVLDRGDNGQGGARFVVNGVRSQEPVIPRYLILYTQDTIGGLKEKFKNLIRSHHLESIDEARKYGFHIVGWNSEATGKVDHRRLEDIFPEYHRSLSNFHVNPATLSEHIQLERHVGNFKESRKTVLEVFVKVARMAKQRPADGRMFTAPKLLAMMNENAQAKQQFKEELLECTKKLSEGAWSDADTIIRETTTKWLNDFFQQQPNDTVKAYYEDAFVPLIPDVEEHDTDDITISIGTVHSVKGMTHCATMYVETSYNNKYESEYMIDDKTTGRGKNKVWTVTSPFLMHDLQPKNKNAAMAKRMLYVGFSRPTHLLCYASDKRLWKDDVLQLMKNAGWRVEIV